MSNGSENYLGTHYTKVNEFSGRSARPSSINLCRSPYQGFLRRLCGDAVPASVLARHRTGSGYAGGRQGRSHQLRWCHSTGRKNAQERAAP